MPKFKMYDVVQVVRLPSQQGNEPGYRSPQIGDRGTILMVYDSPTEGYTVEAVAKDGQTKWLLEFARTN